MDNLVHYAHTTMSTSLLSRSDLKRVVYLRWDVELEQFVQSIEHGIRVDHFNRDVVGVIKPTEKTRKFAKIKKRT